MGYQSLDDRTLLELVILGKEEALECLYERHGRRVFSLAMAILQDRGAAEEVTQEVFLDIWRRAPTFVPERGNVSAWIIGIGHHRTIDSLRQRRRHRNVGPLDEMPRHSPGGRASGNLEEEAVEQETGLHLQNLLGHLPAEQREVILLAYFHGYTQVEIARKTNQPLGTVKTRTRLALQKLQKALGSFEG